MSWHGTRAQRFVATTLVGVGLSTCLITPPEGSAQGPLDDLACKLSSTGISQWVKKANSGVKGVKAFAAAVGFVSDQGCKYALDQWQAGETATIVVDGSTPSPPMRMSFENLLTPSLPAAPAPQPGRTLSEMIADVRYRSFQCSGYQYQYLFDMCMRGELEPVYR